MKIDLKEPGNAWLLVAILLMIGALGVAVIAYVMHRMGTTPWWVVAIMTGLMLISVWCFAMANEAWELEQERAANEPAEFGHYAGPERRRTGLNPTRPSLRVIEVKKADGEYLDRVMGLPPRPTPPSIDEIV